MKKELFMWSKAQVIMLNGTMKIKENKNICNSTPIIEMFMQEWFLEEGVKQIQVVETLAKTCI